jgi:hypothetical protein
MSEPTTSREQGQATVGRLTKLLAGAAVAATALFGVAVASGGKEAADDSTTSVVDDSSYSDYGYDDGFDLGGNQGVWPSSQTPAATSGGS